MSDKSNQEEKEKITSSQGLVPRLNFDFFSYCANCSDFIWYNIRFKWL